MKKIYLQSFIAVCLGFLLLNTKAQSTFSDIHYLMQTNCAGSGCHDGSGSPAFNVTLSDSILYSKLVNVTPLNPAAAAKGDKQIMPGYPDRSFLLRKIAHSIPNVSEHLALTANEGNVMPDVYPNHLAPQEAELIRQWILFGAPKTGVVVDTAVINKYYREGGINDTYAQHAAPAAGTGFQMYMGKIFVRPHTEEYYYLKHKPEYSGNIEVNRIVGLFPQSAHHMVVYKFLPGGDNNYREGLRPESETSHPDVSDGIGMTKGYCEYQLPANTAYFWEGNAVLDFNLHIKNTSDSILATDLYINVYTQTVGTALYPMFIRNFPVFSISIPQDGAEHTDTEIANDTTETHYWKIWQLYSHTHKYGTDYDIFLRNADGSMGNQEYEGWYSYEQDYNVGYYRYGVDVTFKYYPDDSLLQVDPRLGFIHRAKWRNTNGPDPIIWGLTSDEEMMVMGFQYIQGDLLGPLSVEKNVNEDLKWSVYPNPATDAITVNYMLHETSDISVEFTNVLGETAFMTEQKNKPAGNYLEEIDLDHRIAPGIYLLTFRSKNNVTTRRLVIE